jgi:hypothetical protein
VAKEAVGRALETEQPDSPVINEGIIPPEITAKIIKFVRENDHVQIWFYSSLTDPMVVGGRPIIAAAAVVNVPAKAFDAFLAEGMVRVAARLADGHGGAAAA